MALFPVWFPHAISKFWEAWNLKPKPFIWTAKVEDIIQKLERSRARLEEIKPGCTQPRGKKEGESSVKPFARTGDR